MKFTYLPGHGYWHIFEKVKVWLNQHSSQCSYVHKGVDVAYWNTGMDVVKIGQCKSISLSSVGRTEFSCHM